MSIWTNDICKNCLIVGHETIYLLNDIWMDKFGAYFKYLNSYSIR